MSTIIILDTETSGLSTKDSQLLEVGLAVFDLEEGAMADCVSWLVAGRNNPSALAVNGIHDALLARHGHPSIIGASEEVERIFSLQDDPLSFVAHNASFDRQWFSTAVQSLPWVCSQRDLEWPRRAQMGTGSLEKLALAHGIGVMPGHRAMHDVMTLVRVFERCCQTEGVQAIDRMVRKALRPRARFQAGVSFANRKEASDLGFEWDADRRIWWKDIAIEDANTLTWPFKIYPVNS